MFAGPLKYQRIRAVVLTSLRETGSSTGSSVQVALTYNTARTVSRSNTRIPKWEKLTKSFPSYFGATFTKLTSV
jgi:hypothetical protein